MLFPSTVSASLHWIHTPIHSSTDYNKTAKSVNVGLVSQQPWHSNRASYRNSPPYSSVLTSVALYHRMGRIPEKGSASKAGTIWGQNKSTPRLPCKTAWCLTNLFSVTWTPEVSISDWFAPKMSLHEFVPAQTELYSLLLRQVSSANLAEGYSEHSSACPWVGLSGCCCSLTLNILFVLFLPFASSSASAIPASEIILSLQFIWYWTHMSTRHLSKMTVKNCNQHRERNDL